MTSEWFEIVGETHPAPHVPKTEHNTRYFFHKGHRRKAICEGYMCKRGLLSNKKLFMPVMQSTRGNKSLESNVKPLLSAPKAAANAAQAAAIDFSI